MKNFGLIIIAGIMIISCTQSPKQNAESKQEKLSFVDNDSVKDARYNEAIEAYKQAIRIKPDDAAAYFGLGLTYLIIGNKSAAMDEYKILKELDKELANKLFNFIYQ